MAEREPNADSNADPNGDPGADPSAQAAPGARSDPFFLGEWRVEPTLNRLVGPDGDEALNPKALNPKAMEVLVFLAARGDAVVPKDEILAGVWPETFVSDQVLANSVWELRRALGDDARSPRFIQTVPKRGYRLLQPVRPAADEPVDSPSEADLKTPEESEATRAPQVAAAPRSPPRRALAAAVIGVAVLLGVVALVVFVASRQSSVDRGTSSDEAWRQYQLGVEAAEGVREKALEPLRRAVEIDPSFAAAHAALADFYDRQGDRELAEAAIDRALDLAEDRPRIERARYLRLSARIRHDIEEEEKWLRQLAVLDPDPEARFTLAWFLFTHFRLCDESVVGIRKAIEVDPRPHFHLYLGQIAMSCDLPDLALDALDRAVEARPEEASYHGFRGYLHLLAGDYEEAESAIARALELSGEDPWIVHRRALVLHRRYRFDAALEAFRRARGLQLGASGAAASAWAGEALVHLHRARLGLAVEAGAADPLDGADRAADRAVSLVPESPEALAIRGLVDVALGDLDAARQRLAALEAHFATTPSRYDAHYRDHLRGRILEAEGRWREATTAHADAVRGHPLDSAPHRLALARAQLGADEIEEAVGVLYRLLAVDPNHAEARCLAAEAHERAGRDRAADEEWGACAELVPALTGGKESDPALLEALRAAARSAPGESVTRR